MYKKLYTLYSLGIKVFGFKRSISQFVEGLNLDHPSDAKILDVGCGTGVIGLALMKNRQDSILVATDLNTDFLLLSNKVQCKKNGY